ncbi:family 10 glycosylhydrolase [Pseudanabaenaceae cyanobacterium LEGE 13415]|nr:family 10 glycosylhydrolase [Pseudanabaenaceae cyanobacterium LEGE 13415]
MRRAWIFGLLTILALTIVPPAFSQSKFTDIQDHWARSCIESLTQKSIIRGFPNNQFRPNDPVTRAQFAAMMVNAFPDQINSPTRNPIQFKDISANYWARDTIQKAYRSGFFSGFDDGTFRPELQIPRVQALTALASGLKLKPTIELSNKVFADLQDVPNYAKSAIAATTERQISVNFPNAQRLNPNRVATRGEIAAFLCQALPDTKGLISDRYLPKPELQAREIRGVWLTNIDSDVLFDKERLSNAVSELARLNFNTLYPTVLNWGYTLYPSQVMKQDIGFAVDPRPVAAGLQNRDMLKEMITEAHQKGLAVIPWFEFGFMAPKESELAKKHQDWWTQKQDGSVDYEASALDRVQIPVWFSPFKPEVQQYILNLVSEVVDNYDVDGIQFDDHFGLPVSFGYDAYTVSLYKQEHNGKAPPTDAKDAEWMRWRSDKLQAFLTKLFQTVKAKKPNVLISLSPLDLPYAYETFLVDWHKWEQAGLIEEVIPQIYFEGQKFVDRINPNTWATLRAARDHIPTAIGVLSGLSSTPRPIDELQRQVKALRDQGYSGMSFFFYETLWNKSPEPTNIRKAGWQSLFKEKLPRASVINR